MDVDVAVIGGGIAGVSVAAELTRAGQPAVLLLERESQLAYHTSGRSAAAFLESYGSPEVRALTRASRGLIAAGQAAAAAPAPLLTPRPMLWVGTEEHADAIQRLLVAEPALRPASGREVSGLCPALRPAWTAAAAVEVGAQDIDVAALLGHYRRLAVGHGAQIRAGAGVTRARPDRDGWLLFGGAGTIRARILVNAAGAWADEFAARCGVRPCGLIPLRRTVAIATADAADRTWPLVCDVAETFYFRPESGGLLVSPADETPSPPCDARAATEDVALALERVNQATTLHLRHVRTAWAGLRTFSPDRNPVVGFDPAYPNFFWLAGQGGYGMQTSPGIAALAASLLLDRPLPDELAATGLDPSRLSPARFAKGTEVSHPTTGHS